MDRLALLGLGAGGLLASFLLGRARTFANLSSHLQLYRARLTRAYLGATNPVRWTFPKPLTDPIDGDDIPWSEYTPHAWGGPIHLINVTINETLSGETQLDQRDRKGLCLAVGPAGLSVGAKHHGVWTKPAASATAAAHDGAAPLRLQRVAPTAGYQVLAEEFTDTERLTIGHWVGISGAAFTTGLGSRTSLGTSLLLGLANIRLGYWWHSGSDPARRKHSTAMNDLDRLWERLARVFPVQVQLLEELLARFYGPAHREWYLSDGGHFDNTGLYELIRRRVPFIIACDNGCDPQYKWSDLGDLVRKARTDLGAEITLLDGKALKDRVADDLHPYLAPWTDFRPYAPRESASVAGGGAPNASPYATLATVTYRDSADTSTILIIKPGIRGGEPADIITYWAGHESFPQETTLDQYFDEAQWESYRKLGRHIGDCLFDPSYEGKKRWAPCQLRGLGA